MYRLTTTHCFTESVTKPHSDKEYLSGDSSNVVAVQSHLKECLIALAFCIMGDVFEICSSDLDLHNHIRYSFTFLPDTGVDNEYPLCYNVLLICVQRFAELDCSESLLLCVCQ